MAPAILVGILIFIAYTLLSCSLELARIRRAIEGDAERADLAERRHHELMLAIISAAPDPIRDRQIRSALKDAEANRQIASDFALNVARAISLGGDAQRDSADLLANKHWQNSDDASRRAYSLGRFRSDALQDAEHRLEALREYLRAASTL